MNSRSHARIGVLTFHKCINYGSFWQAKSLVDWLQSIGHEAVLLDYNSPRANIAELKCAFRPSLPTPVPKDDRPLYRKKIEAFFRAFETLPVSKQFSLEQPGAMEEYDLVIVGSDEVWNLAHPWYGGCELFYGEGLRTDRAISYAASFGNYEAAAGLPAYWSNLLRSNFQAISVRDENSRSLVQSALGKAPVKVVDPCLLHPPQAALSNRLIDEPYVAVYGHNFSPKFAHSIRAWAIDRNLQTVSVGYRNDWADTQFLSADPYEFAGFMAQSHAVGTNFFHGCVFALNNNKPFACEAIGYRNNKISDLVNTFELPDRLLSEPDYQSVDACLSSPPDALPAIAVQRTESEGYLMSSLQLHATA